MKKKTHQQLVSLMRQYGLDVEKYDGGHIAITKDGARVGTVSHTGESNACRQAVRDLWRQGLVDEAAKRVKFS